MQLRLSISTVLLCACLCGAGEIPVVQETPLGNGADYDAVKALTFSLNNRHLAFLGVKGDKQFVVQDGAAGPAYDWVLPDSLAGTMDLSRFGFIVQNGNDIAAVVDGKVVGHGYYSIGGDRITFSQDGKHYAYKARRGSEEKGDSIVVRDGVEGKAYSAIQPVPTFSPDGNHLLYVAGPDATKVCVVVDDKEGPVFDGISAATVVFSPDSQRIAYAASSAGKVVAVIDGKPQTPYSLMRIPPMFSPDGKHVVYISGSTNQFSVILDGVEGPKFETFTDGSVVFSPDSKHLAYAARAGKQWQMILDGRKQRSFDLIAGASITFSPDSSHLAYVGINNGKRMIIVDGKEQSGTFDNVLWPGPIFSPDSKHVAYAGVQFEHVRVVLDGKDSTPYDTVAQLAFSPDSKHLTYRAFGNRQVMVVIDGKESPRYDDVSPIIFSPDASHYAYEALAGDRATLFVDGTALRNTFSDWVKGAIPSFADNQTLNYLMRRDRQFIDVTVRLPGASTTPTTK